MKRIAILASGSGTNAENIVRRFADSPDIEVAAVITNRAHAGVIDRLRPYGIEVEYFGRDHWLNPEAVVKRLQALRVDLVVLAGFLAIIREPLLTAYCGRIVNIHPSLLPRHGGPGMYGDRVHQAVLQSGDTISGITIHLVDAGIDAGPIVEQHSLDVLPGDTPHSLAERIHVLEYAHYPEAIKRLLS